jgi:hypothetical protein
VSSPKPLPPKKDVALALLGASSVCVHLDPRRARVTVPPQFKNQAQLVLEIGWNMPVPAPDLRIDDGGISATLSFNRSPFFCVVPWASVFAIVGKDSRGMVWPNDVPPEVPLQPARAPVSPGASVSPGNVQPFYRPWITATKSDRRGCLAILGCLAFCAIIYCIGWCLVKLVENMTSVSALLSRHISNIANALSWLGDWSPVATIFVVLFIWFALLVPTQATLVARAASWVNSSRILLWFLLAIFDGAALLLVTKASNHVPAFSRWPLLGDDWSRDDRGLVTLAVLLAGALLWYAVAVLFRTAGNMRAMHESVFILRAASDVFVKLPVFVYIAHLFSRDPRGYLPSDSFGGSFGLLVARGFLFAGCCAYALTMFVARRRLIDASQ